MAAKIDTPAAHGLPDLGASYRPPGSVPVYVGGVDAAGNPHHWGSVAAASNLSPQALIHFNYGTTIPEVVNFYLQRNCGCTVLAADGKNLRFIGASPGLIYVPAFVPVEAFTVSRLKEMDIRAHPVKPGVQQMVARFAVRIRLSSKLVDPRLYEYRQMIRGGGYIHQGEWVGGVWRPKTTTGPVPTVLPPVPIPGTTFKIPGIPAGLLPNTWKEDGKVTPGGNLFYGHRGNPPAPPDSGRDQYSADDRHYENEDFPGLEEILARDGLLVNLHFDFKGVVVRFDRPPGTPGRKIVEQVAEKNWSFSATRKVLTVTPLLVMP